MKTDVKSAVYRFVGTSGVNHLALMVGVYSNDPLETLRKYLQRSAVETHEEPRLVPTLSADSPKLDLILESIPGEPGYAIRNRLKQSCLERILVDRDGEAVRPFPLPNPVHFRQIRPQDHLRRSTEPRTRP